MNIATTQRGRSATQMTDDTQLQARIREQPGYMSGQTMRVMRVNGTDGAYRLYVLIGGRWMDGSLQDM